MKKSDFSFNKIKANFLKIKQDNKQLRFEIIYAVIPLFFYLLIVWLPFYTIKVNPKVHVSLVDSHLFFRIVFYTSWLSVFVLYLFSRVTILKPFSFIVLGFLLNLELLYFALGMQQFSVHKANFAGFVNFNLNVGFYFLLLHIGLLMFVILMPKLVNKIIVNILNKKSPLKEERLIELSKEEEVAFDSTSDVEKEPEEVIITEDEEASTETSEKSDTKEEEN